MLYMPSVFSDNLMDDFFGDRWFTKPAWNKQTAASLMRTDIKEGKTDYEMSIDLPGFNKEDVQLELSDGYLSISASHNDSKDEKDDEGKIIRQERYSGSMQRSFYVGKDLKQEDIKAQFTNGVLSISFPKEDQRQAIPEKKTIYIEG